MSKYVGGEDMQCPVCGMHLQPMDERRYETLSEHVSNPNGEPSIKTGYGCPNVGKCKAADGGVRWLHDGEGPYTKEYGLLDRTERYPPNTYHAGFAKNRTKFL